MALKHENKRKMRRLLILYIDLEQFDSTERFLFCHKQLDKLGSLSCRKKFIHNFMSAHSVVGFALEYFFRACFLLFPLQNILAVIYICGILHPHSALIYSLWISAALIRIADRGFYSEY